jgi:hypothetical protein
MKKLIMLVVMSFVLLPADAQEDEEEETVQTGNYRAIGIFYDQDYTLEMLGLRKLNEDRNYTMGLGFYYSDPSLKRSFLFKPHSWLNKVFQKPFLNGANSIPAIMIANGSFTPDSLPASYVVRNDRPYSSLTYLQTLRSYVDNEAFKTYTSSFSIGVIGTYISREVQTAIHKLANENDTKHPRTPRGWNNQVAAGGEPTAAYAFKKERLITKKHVKDQALTTVNAIEFKDAWQYSLGYFTSVNYELNFRAGKIDPRHWTYMVNPLSQSNKSLFSDSSMQRRAIELPENPEIAYYERPKTFELYVFGSIRPAFMLYNALLNGQFKKSVHTIGFQDMRHFLLELDGGLGTTLPTGRNKLIEFKLKFSGRSPEFKLPGRPPRWHYWGGVELLFSAY